MDNHKLTLITSIGIALMVLFIAVGNTGPTGAIIVGSYQGPNGDNTSSVVASRLHDKALDFFDISDIVFPHGACIPAAHELYGNVAYRPTDVTTGFSTTGEERVSTLSFVIDRHERYGTIDFVKTPTFLRDRDESTDSMISISSEAIVRVPKASRTTYMVMDLYGKTEGPFMYINRGRFSTPTVDCVFLVKNGKALCDCDVHTIKGIAIGGVTSPPPSEDRYKALISRAQKTYNETGRLEDTGIVVTDIE